MPNTQEQLEKFYQQVRSCARRWQIGPTLSNIQTSDKEHECPWLAVIHHNETINSGLYQSGLYNYPDLNNAEEIFNAADNKDVHNPEIRRRLLEACGLA